MEVLLPYLKLDPQFDVGVGQSLAEKGRIVANKTKALLLLYLFEVEFLVAEHYLVARLLLVYYLKKFALFGLIAHIVPHANSPALLERPAHLLRHFESLSTVQVNVGVELGVLWGLLVE